MAEPTERPDSTADQSSASSLAYQPLSFLAIVGLGIAVVYALVVLVGFSWAMFSGTPWLMTSWTLLIPAAGLGVSLIARSRIRHSEGTLAGLALASWGGALCLVAALIYCAYTLTTYLVLRREAESFTQQWFERLKQGDYEGAFTLTLPPATRPADGPGLRNDLEIRFNNAPDPNSHGAFSQLQQSEAARLLAHAGGDAKVQLLAVRDWDYTQGGYHVVQRYRISTPECTLDLVTPVFRAKTREKDHQGLEWAVLQNAVKVEQRTLTDKGNELLQLQGQAQGFASLWRDMLRKGQLQSAYFATVPFDRRTQMDKLYQGRFYSALAALPALGTVGRWEPILSSAAVLSVVPEACMPGYRTFQGGTLVECDVKKFWPEGERQKEAVEDVKKLFGQPGEGLGRSLELSPVSLGPWRIEGDRCEVRRDVSIMLPGKYIVDGFLVLESNLRAHAQGGPAEWRVVALELVRARDFPAPPKARGGPR